MMWGLTAGLLAGIVGGPVALVLHLPTRVFVWWVASVAHVAARAPLGELRATHVLLLAGAVVSFSFVRVSTARGAVGAMCVVILAHPLLTFGQIGPGEHDVASGLTAWRGPDGATVLVVGAGARERSSLEALRRHGVRRVSLVVAVDGGRASGEVVRAIRSRVAIAEIWAPSMHKVRGARTPSIGAYRVGSLSVEVTSNDTPLRATLRVASDP
jgi:hypothetical protein